MRRFSYALLFLLPVSLCIYACDSSEDPATTPDVVEAEDIAETPDTVETTDVAEPEDVLESTDITEATDTTEATDIVEAADTVEATDTVETEDAGETQDAGEPEDTVEVEDTTEAEDTWEEEDITEDPDAAGWDPADYPIPDTEDCHIEFRTRLNGTKYAQVASDAPAIELTARAKNLTDVPLLLQLTSSCPGGAAAFSGLPEGYDYHGTCLMGACMESQTTVQYLILPYSDTFADYPIDTSDLSVGGDECNDALPSNAGQNSEYNITFTVELVGDNPNVCYPGDNDGNGEPDDALLTVCPGVCPD